MKKVVILYPAHYEEATGGAELQIHYLVQYLKSSFEIHYIYCKKNGIIKNTDKLILHPMKRKKIKFVGQAWFLYKKDIERILISIRPDFIYTRLGSSWMYFAEAYALKHHIKHIHAFASDLDVSRKYLYPIFPIGQIIENFFINRAIKIGENYIVQNVYQQNRLQTRFNKKSIIVKQMTELVDSSNIQKNIDDKILIVWIGNLKPIKQPEKFIRLVQLLNNSLTNTYFLMIGKSHPKYRSLIEATMHKHKSFKYLGQLPQNSVNKILSQAHILINTSLFEGFSNTYVQAWMRKCIVLALNSNPDNIIIQENIGYVIPNIAILAKKIQFLIRHKNILNEMSNRAYYYAIKNHAIEKNIHKIIKLFQ